MKKTFVYILATLLLTSLASCTKERSPFLEPHTEIYNGYFVSTFYTDMLWEVDQPGKFLIRLIGENSSTIVDLNTSCEYTDEYMKVSIKVPAEIHIKDGYYILISSHFRGECPKRYRVQITGGKIGTIDDIDKEGYALDLNGSGTESDPYEIGSSEDFNNFLKNLGTDEHKGAGYYFKQTEDIQWNSGTTESNRTLGNLSFGGSYNGNGKVVTNMSYIGGGDATKDSDRGIFKSLINGAVIKNLYIKNIFITNAHSRVGVIAGNASHHVVLDSVAISGNLQGYSSLGGLVGYVKDADSMIIQNCMTNLSIQSSSGDDLGGAIGKLENSKLIINGLHTASSASLDNFSIIEYTEDVYSDIYQVTASGNNVGGVVGHVMNSSFEMDDVVLLHSSNKFNDDIKIVYGKGNIGGVIGNLESLSAQSAIKNSDIALIVTSSKDPNVGGYIGSAILSKNLDLISNNVCGVITGDVSVGGAIGYLEFIGSAALNIDGFYFGSHENLQTLYYSEGNKYVGGFVGYVKGNSVSSSKIKVNNLSIAANVTSPNSGEPAGYVGGFAGYVSKTAIIWNKSCVGTSSIEIKGPFRVGGLIGELTEGSLDADNSYTLNKTTPTIPSSSTLTKCFWGKVLPYDQKSQSKYMGGAIGNVYRSPVNGVHVHATVTGTGNYTGGVFGFVSYDSDIVIDDCSFAGEVWGSEYAGGIAGEVEKRGKLQECINYGSINGGGHLGGVVGHVQYQDDEPYVNYCVNLGSVSGTNFVGGVVGAMSGGSGEWCKIHHSANYGSVTGKATSSSPYPGIGGILGKGKSRRCEVKYCVNFGTVTGSGTNVCVGGVAGKMGSGSDDVSLNVSMRQSANYGEVSSSTKDSYVGGVLGYLERANKWNEDNSIAEDCYNAGYIPSDLDNDAGGIVGCSANHSLIRRCVNYGNVPHGNGIMGTQDGSGDYENCYTLYNTYKEGESTDIWPKSVNIFYQGDMGSEDYWNKSELNMNDTWIVKNGKAELRNCPFQYSTAPQN
ncbi:MAG: hypothetical protein IKW65_03735 [Bacteroidales bacterium]|nr:hypothetical protein [Bacteroidales bacterium]